MSNDRLSNLYIIPLKLKQANTFINNHHRHHKGVIGYHFAIGLKYLDQIVGVAICGRPLNRFLDDGKTIELLRLCVLDDIKNGCSKLYGACSRIAKEMGFEKIITYTLQSEKGGSLIASGWKLEVENVGGGMWNRKKDTCNLSLFPEIENKYPIEKKSDGQNRFT